MKRYDMYQDYDMLVKPEEHVRGEWVYYDDAQTTIARLTAERDQALASASAAAIEMRERAANEACYDCGSQDIIRILPLHDPATSLAEMLDAETRACAEVCNGLVHAKQQRHGYKTAWGAMGCRKAILARLDQRKEPTP